MCVLGYRLSNSHLKHMCSGVYVCVPMSPCPQWSPSAVQQYFHFRQVRPCGTLLVGEEGENMELLIGFPMQVY